jgi:hypothetical protein
MVIAFDSISCAHGIAAAIKKSTNPRLSVAQAFNSWFCVEVSVSLQQSIAIAAKGAKISLKGV